jgi:hypothetical protein
MAIDITSPRTRRAILMGALGGTIAAVAAAVGGTSSVTATDGDPVLVGQTYTASTVTEIDVTGGATAFSASSDSWIGVYGHSNSGRGVDGESTSGIGVYGGGDSGFGVHGDSISNRGVFGTSISSDGVHGLSISGVGVRGTSSAGRGGQFSGKKAQLRLLPSGATTHPTTGALGDLFLDKSGRLWFCKGGTTWVKLA